MREVLLEVCIEMERVRGVYSLPMTVVMVGMVGNTLLPSLGANLHHPEEALHPMAMRGVRPKHRPAEPTHNLAGGLLDFSTPQTPELWPDYSCHF